MATFISLYAVHSGFFGGTCACTPYENASPHIASASRVFVFCTVTPGSRLFRLCESGFTKMRPRQVRSGQPSPLDDAHRPPLGPLRSGKRGLAVLWMVFAES